VPLRLVTLHTDTNFLGLRYLGKYETAQRHGIMDAI